MSVISTKDLKVAHAKAWMRDKLEKTKDFCRENKEAIAILTPFGYAIGKGIVKDIRKNAYLKKEDHLKNCFIYDRSMGCYYETKRKLTNNERYEIEKRKARGEKLGYILRSMRVLK